MEAVVKMPFKDKDTENIYQKDDAYSGKKERVIFLVEKGFLEVVNKQPPEDKQVANTEPVHVGGGYYELPTGEKIQGKEKAQEVFEALKNE